MAEYELRNDGCAEAGRVLGSDDLGRAHSCLVGDNARLGEGF